MQKKASWPRVIRFHGERFQVRLVSEEALAKTHDGEAPLADYDYDTNTIRVWRDLQHESRWTALLHEILHLSTRIAHGKEPGFKHAIEEALIGSIDTILYEILSKNFGFGYKEVKKLISGVNFRSLKGYKFDLLNPDEQMIDIEEIAYILSRLCRYNGHIPGKRFLSVAEHSVMVCERIQSGTEYGSVNVPLVALLHDASETYIGDIISPIKRYIPEIRELESGIQEAIWKKFGLKVSDKVARVVKSADERVYEIEKMNHALIRENEAYESAIGYLAPETAEKRFMSKFKEVYRAKTNPS